MTLRDATTEFLIRARANEFSEPVRFDDCARSLELLNSRFPHDIALKEIDASAIRAFLANCYIESLESTSTAVPVSRASQHRALATGFHKEISPDGLQVLCDSLEAFFEWAESLRGAAAPEAQSQIVRQEREKIARAQKITSILAGCITEQGGAFAFPEFLTSFEQGGRSEYDFDAPGEVGVIEGYFRISRIAGELVEAHELISDESVWPIIFPPAVASILMPDFIISLELVRRECGWQIADCGFAYPPGTDI